MWTHHPHLMTQKQHNLRGRSAEENGFFAECFLVFDTQLLPICLALASKCHAKQPEGMVCIFKVHVLKTHVWRARQVLP